MDATLTLGIASLAGAALFYCAGYLSRSLRGDRARPDTAAAPPAPSPSPSPPALPGAAASPTESPGEADAIMGSDMDALLARVAASGAARSLVVADDLGLIVASSGEAAAHEPLAVITSSVGELCEKARSELHMDGIQSIRIIDQSGQVLSCRFFAHGGQPLAVTALSVPGKDASSEIERALARLVQIIEDHNAAPRGAP